jgi:hypothetical protein
MKNRNELALSCDTLLERMIPLDPVPMLTASLRQDSSYLVDPKDAVAEPCVHEGFRRAQAGDGMDPHKLTDLEPGLAHGRSITQVSRKSPSDAGPGKRSGGPGRWQSE